MFYRDEIADYYKTNGLPEPYEGTARRKIVPETLEQRVLAAFGQRPAGAAPLFRKTSCAVSYAHGLPDYNGHYGIRELCNICPAVQLDVCAQAHTAPTARQLQDAAAGLPEAASLRVLDISDRAAEVDGLPSEQPRYFLQHRFAFQVHAAGHPHRPSRHGRAEIGWETPMDDLDLQSPWTSLTYAVIDVEGNGQQPPDLVELAIVPISEGQIADPITWLVRPPRPVLPMARRFHHISDADVASSPSITECVDEMRSSLDDAVFVAHNAHIDLGVLTRELPGFAPTHIIDTVKLARRLLPGMDSYKLSALVDAFDLADGLPDDLAPHRATYDALVCARLLTRLAAPPDAKPRAVGELLDQPERRKPKGGTGDDSATALF